jgi:nitroimidazol reductase NimA-like FMN-containing flavoprotein (pyridoxamine 5'-phosphate oxidase superfamily)
MVVIDQSGLHVLEREECLRLLRSATLGRVGATSRALPVVLPVNFRVVDGDVIFRTAAGTKLDMATRNAVVAFEVDDMDPIAHTGWSVVVTGVAREVTDPAELARLAGENIPRWAPRGECRTVAVSTDLVSGRRLAHGIAANEPESP